MRLILAFALLCTGAYAQLTTAQRESDFRTLANLVGRYYAPLEWKKAGLGVDAFDLTPWLAKVRAVKNDLEFHRVCIDYLSQFKDGHVSYLVPSTFVADAGLRADIYDGKLLLYSVNRATYPAAQFPQFAVGNEVVSVDGRPALAIVEELAKTSPAGSGRAAVRSAATDLFIRQQILYPEASLLADTSEVVVRNAAGEQFTYTAKWTKSGVAVGDIPTPVTPSSPARRSLEPELKLPVESPGLRRFLVRRPFLEQHRGPEPPLVIRGQDSGQTLGETTAVLGVGARTPYYGLPTGFVVRRGRLQTDNFFSGTYVADGLRIGLIRIPTFLPDDPIGAIQEFSTEIAFLKANTDGLVIDVTRNGGGYIGLTQAYFSRLTTRPFAVLPSQALPSTNDMLTYEQLAELISGLTREAWVNTKWRWLADEVTKTYKAGNRQLTIPLPLYPEIGVNLLQRAPLYDDNFPWRDNAGQALGYDKPVITLVDDFSASAADLFPAIFQDNQRGLIVGTTTMGLGGAVTGFDNVLPFTQASISLTMSLTHRKRVQKVAGLPDSPYIENVGVIPDTVLDYQTRDNLLNQGRDFVAGFTRIISEQIKAGR